MSFQLFPVSKAVHGLGHGLVARSERFEVWASRSRQKGQRAYHITFSALEIVSQEPRQIREIPLPRQIHSNLKSVVAFLEVQS